MSVSPVTRDVCRLHACQEREREAVHAQPRSQKQGLFCYRVCVYAGKHHTMITYMHTDTDARTLPYMSHSPLTPTGCQMLRGASHTHILTTHCVGTAAGQVVLPEAGRCFMHMHTHAHTGANRHSHTHTHRRTDTHTHTITPFH